MAHNGWKVSVDEIAPYQFRVLAIAADGRRIEMTGPDEERMHAEVLTSIDESDAQVAKKLMERKGNDDRIS